MKTHTFTLFGIALVTIAIGAALLSHVARREADGGMSVDQLTETAASQIILCNFDKTQVVSGHYAARSLTEAGKCTDAGTKAQALKGRAVVIGRIEGESLADVSRLYRVRLLATRLNR